MESTADVSACVDGLRVAVWLCYQKGWRVMRTAYHEKLAALSEQIGQMCGLAAAAIDNATQAPLRTDLTLAERVITDRMQMAEMSVAAERSAVTLLALQQPVAGELRAIFGSSQIVADVYGMGALAVHVAKIARHRHPRHALPAEVDGCFAEMGRVAVELATAPRKCCDQVVPTRPPACAERTT
jgi:phosphate transport system protein